MSFKVLPRDVLKRILFEYLYFGDITSIFLTAKVFHRLTEDEKSLLYKKYYVLNKYAKLAVSIIKWNIVRGKDLDPKPNLPLKGYVQCPKCLVLINPKKNRHRWCNGHGTGRYTECHDGIYIFSVQGMKPCGCRFYPWDAFRPHHCSDDRNNIQGGWI